MLSPRREVDATAECLERALSLRKKDGSHFFLAGTHGGAKPLLNLASDGQNFHLR